MHAPSPAPGRLAPCTAPVVTPWFHPPQGVWNHDNIRSTTVVLGLAAGLCTGGQTTLSPPTVVARRRRRATAQGQDARRGGLAPQAPVGRREGACPPERRPPPLHVPGGVGPAVESPGLSVAEKASENGWRNHSEPLMETPKLIFWSLHECSSSHFLASCLMHCLAQGRLIPSAARF